MATTPSFLLSLLAFPQRFDGSNLNLRILVLPQGDPLSPLITGASPAPDSPAFADAAPKLVAELIPSLAALPPRRRQSRIHSPPTTPLAFVRCSSSSPRSSTSHRRARPTSRRTGYTRSRIPAGQLPERRSTSPGPRTPFASTDDTYHCLLTNPAVTTPQPPPPSTGSAGQGDRLCPAPAAAGRRARAPA